MSNVGRVLYGFCDGYFDDSWGPKRIEAEGYDWIVAREVDTGEVVTTVIGPEFKQESIEKWSRGGREDIDV